MADAIEANEPAGPGLDRDFTSLPAVRGRLAVFILPPAVTVAPRRCWRCGTLEGLLRSERFRMFRVLSVRGAFHFRTRERLVAEEEEGRRSFL